MGKLNTEPNLADPDGFYEALVKMTAGLDDAAAQVAMSKLVLLLANHIGDDSVLREAITLARAQSNKSSS